MRNNRLRTFAPAFPFGLAPSSESDELSSDELSLSSSEDEDYIHFY